MKQVITRKDGIVYKRKIKEFNYDVMVSTRITKKDYEKLISISEKKNIKVRTLIRDIIEDYIK